MAYRIDYHIHHNHTPKRPVDVQATPEDVTRLIEDGYLVLENLFAGDALERLRTAMLDVAAQEDHTVRSGREWGGVFLRHLMDKHEAFLDLFRLEPCLSLARATLGPQVQVLPMTGRIAWPDADGQATPWHLHQRVVPSPRPAFFSLPHVLDALIYLDDLDEKSGPVCVVPGSHRWEGREFPGGPHDDIEGQVSLKVPAGSVVMIHGNLWHRGLPTTPDCAIRRLLILPYAHAWVQLPTFGTRPDNGLMRPLFDNPDPETRELLGIPDGIY
jgi:ectoine hydroxylase-related dioxygenase (phytanoyl-CoA dioxygenase family)